MFCFLKRIFVLLLICSSTIAHGIFYRLHVSDNDRRSDSLSFKQQRLVEDLLKKVHGPKLLEILTASGIEVNPFDNLEHIVLENKQLREKIRKQKRDVLRLQEEFDIAFSTSQTTHNIEGIFEQARKKQQKVYTDRATFLLKKNNQTSYEKLSTYLKARKTLCKDNAAIHKYQRKQLPFHDMSVFNPLQALIVRFRKTLSLDSRVSMEGVLPAFLEDNSDGYSTLSASEERFVIAVLKNIRGVLSLLEHSGKHIKYSIQDPSCPLNYNLHLTIRLKRAHEIKNSLLYQLESLCVLARRSDDFIKKDFSTVNTLSLLRHLETLKKIRCRTPHTEESLASSEDLSHQDQSIKECEFYMKEMQKKINLWLSSKYIGFSVVERIPTSIVAVLSQNEKHVKDPIRRKKWFLAKKRKVKGPINDDVSFFERDTILGILRKANAASLREILGILYLEVNDYDVIQDFYDEKKRLKKQMSTSNCTLSCVISNLDAQIYTSKNIYRQIKEEIKRNCHINMQKELQQLQEEVSAFYLKYTMLLALSSKPIPFCEAVFSKNDRVHEKFMRSICTHRDEKNKLQEKIHLQQKEKLQTYTACKEHTVAIKDALTQHVNTVVTPVKRDQVLFNIRTDDGWRYALAPSQITAVIAVLRDVSGKYLHQIFKEADIKFRYFNLSTELKNQVVLKDQHKTTHQQLYTLLSKLTSLKIKLEQHQKFIIELVSVLRIEGQSIYLQRVQQLNDTIKSLKSFLDSKSSSTQSSLASIPSPSKLYKLPLLNDEYTQAVETANLEEILGQVSKAYEALSNKRPGLETR